MMKPEGDDAIFGGGPKKVSSTPLSLQQRRRKTIFLNAIGLVLDIDRSVPTLRSHDCIRMFDARNTPRKGAVSSGSIEKGKCNTMLIIVGGFTQLDRCVNKCKYTIYVQKWLCKLYTQYVFMYKMHYLHCYKNIVFRYFVILLLKV
ncbi:uncharacterized protein LOC122573107 [Bombus pyrosoma]|uniref:uncharacterized protein LOC122573107 n=1 Tax=Bombus pyrosoma TaxID=396416 RepID=UPI001CB9D19B|nr:uncharacterized protein LOC122573107 [Bombus pyrosoma]